MGKRAREIESAPRSVSEGRWDTIIGHSALTGVCYPKRVAVTAVTWKSFETWHIGVAAAALLGTEQECSLLQSTFAFHNAI